LTHLQHLQQAILADEPTLRKLMLASALGKLHAYIDYLTTQDSLGALRRVAAKLSPEDWKFFQKYQADFFDLTRPLRRSSLSTHLDQSQISEQVQGPEGQTSWQLIWQDLAQTSVISRIMAHLPVHFHSSPANPCAKTGHHLMTRHLTRQTDGVHFEAYCTCNAILEGIGADEDQAISSLWDHFREHYARFQEQVEK
jgi:hypothetical protein